jgi:hypothetical protein
MSAGRDLESGDVNLEFLPVSSPPLLLSHSSPPTTTTHTKNNILLLTNQDSLNQRQKRANSDPISQSKQVKNSFLSSSFPIQLKSSLSKQFSQQQKLFYCSICFENYLEIETISLSSCLLNHSYCIHCIQSLLKIQISDGNLKIICPLSSSTNPCSGIFTENEILNLLITDEITKEKYYRFKEMKSDPDYRECPNCKEPSHGQGNQTQPEIICSSCQMKYCYFHSNAHPTSSCSDYTRQQLLNEREAQRAIRSISRNCPSCGIPTEKNGGCNHMTCRQCGEVL